MADDSGKTEKPTAKRLREARKEGNFPRTQDAATWAGIAAGVALVPHTMGLVGDDFRRLLALLPDIARDPEPARLFALVGTLPMMLAEACLPIAITASLAATAATASQGVHPSGKVLKFKAKGLNPLPGIKRMFGPRASWEAVKALLKVVVIALVVAVLARSLVPDLVTGALPTGAVLDRTRRGLQSLVWATAVAGLALAFADYAFQRRTVMKNLRMSHRDIKDENRQTEGDPLVKSAIRSKQMAMSRNRMLQAVATADVVLVNPTHFAVALRYEAAKGAPRVVAKGAGSLALKIRERAHENRVAVVEDKPLARSLYAICELGDEIPTELYLAVARILAFVMQAGRPMHGTTTARRPVKETVVPDLPTRSALKARKLREAREAKETSRP